VPLAESAHSDLSHWLLNQLSGLFAPALYEVFAQLCKGTNLPAEATEQHPGNTVEQYNRFVADMKAGGFRRMFTEKPVLLRLAATIVRQWIVISGEFVVRLYDDLGTIKRELLSSNADFVTSIDYGLSDPHNSGHSVLIVHFGNGARIVYKPKDLRLDMAWHALVERLNQLGAPIQLKAPRSIARSHYGWAEFIAHTACVDVNGCKRFFSRAGAWLALFHWFAANDMHQENLIAAGEHPVPIDLETILQRDAEEQKSVELEAQAFAAASEIIDSSVAMVGWLPSFTRTPNNNIYAIGGMVSDFNSEIRLSWNDINSDAMRPFKSKETRKLPNLPRINLEYAIFEDYIEEFTKGFEEYAGFLLRVYNMRENAFCDEFAGCLVRKVLRPTQFYYMLLQRLKDHRRMGDGVIWSAQADFVARLADWDSDADLLWPLQRAERAALISMNVPYFSSRSDGQEIQDGTGISVITHASSGLARAHARASGMGPQEIAWQVEVILQNKSSLSRSALRTLEMRPLLRTETPVTPPRETFIAEADKIALELSSRAIRRGPAAAWIGLDWLGDSEVWQLVALGPDLYNGLSGVALFLSAHAAVTRHDSSRELALAAMSYIRKSLKSRSSARLARSFGLGSGSGLGSIVYSLSVMSRLLNDDDLLDDACAAAELFTDDLIAADKHLDIMAGSAGGILGLLRLHRDSGAAGVLARATKCGEHLLAQPRITVEGAGVGADSDGGHCRPMEWRTGLPALRTRFPRSRTRQVAAISRKRHRNA
jgi:type 2 lantibiotic biosynthesis protein LanM